MRAAVGSAPLGLVIGHGREYHNEPEPTLWFLDNKTIVATFVTREGEPSLSSRDDSDANLPLRLRAVFLDAHTGKLAATQAWPTESRIAGIIAVHGGMFVTQRGTVLTLYSSDAKELRRLSLPPILGDSSRWGAGPSPAGGSILFVGPKLTANSATPWIWVDTDSLQIVRSWKEIQSGRVCISDSIIAMTACVSSFYHCDPNVEVRGLATDWKTIAPIERSYQALPEFVNQDILFLPGDHLPSIGPWKLLRTDGKVVLTEDAPFGGGRAVPSAGGQRFVVPLFKLKGNFPALDIAGHGVLQTISVYDAPFQTRYYNLDVRGPKITQPPAVKFALSPDGSLLAILHDESVYLFEIPPPSLPPTPSPSKAEGSSRRE